MLLFLTLPNCPGEGGGGGAQLVPSRVSVVLVEGTIAEDGGHSRTGVSG